MCEMPNNHTRNVNKHQHQPQPQPGRGKTTSPTIESSFANMSIGSYHQHDQDYKVTYQPGQSQSQHRYRQQHQKQHRHSRYLYIDGLNYLSQLWAIRFSKQGDPLWPLPQKLEINVGKFVKSLRQQGWKMMVFIDASIATEETMNIWKTRREKELRNESRPVPQGGAVMLAEAFRAYGVTVHHSWEADNDDTLVAYAYHQYQQLQSQQTSVMGRVAILSGDRDMFRYEGIPYDKIDIYRGFTMQRGHVKLDRQQGTHRKFGTCMRTLPKTLPHTLTHPAYADAVTRGMYTRGSPSPLTRCLGNLHVLTKPLRHILWKMLGVTGSITLTCPVWDHGTNQCVWHYEEITITSNDVVDEKLYALLTTPNILATSPDKIVKYIFGDHLSMTLDDLNSISPSSSYTKVQLSNHQYACYIIVYEIIVLAFHEYQRTCSHHTSTSTCTSLAHSFFNQPHMSLLEMMKRFYSRSSKY